MTTITKTTVIASIERFLNSPNMRAGLQGLLWKVKFPGWDSDRELTVDQDEVLEILRDKFDEVWAQFFDQYVSILGDIPCWPENLELVPVGDSDELYESYPDNLESIQKRCITLAKAVIDADFKDPYKEWLEVV